MDQFKCQQQSDNNPTRNRFNRLVRNDLKRDVESDEYRIGIKKAELARKEFLSSLFDKEDRTNTFTYEEDPI